MKKILMFLGILLSAGTLYSSQIPAATEGEITVLSPVEKILPQRYKDFNGYQEDAMKVMMSKNSEPLLTEDVGNIFAVYMISHHEAAIITSTGVLNFTENDKVKKIAENIISAQEKEVAILQKMLSSGELKGNDAKEFKKEMSEIMKNMMKEIKVSSKPLTDSKEVSIIYLTNMIYHHDGAVKMAEAYLKLGKNEDLIKMCNDIVSSQTAEIKEMSEILKEYGAPIPKIK